MWKNFPLFPERASALAWQVDGLYFLLTAVSAFFTLLIFVLILVFAIKYRRSVHPHPEQIEGSLPLELAWTLIPLGICMVFFAWGSLIFFQEARPPKGAMEVYAVAKQWMWKFEYEGGQRDINQLHVPVGRDVKMIMSSQDVIHSFYVPAFRIKADVLPGRYTETWFRPTKAGTYHLFCAEYCGTDHSGMIGQVIVMEPADYQAWMSGGSCHRFAGVEWRAALPAVGMRHLPSLRYPGTRAEPDRHLWQAGVAGGRTHRHGRRELHSRIHPESGREDRLRIQAHHADLPGPGLGRELDGAGGLRQIVVASRRERRAASRLLRRLSNAQ